MAENRYNLDNFIVGTDKSFIEANVQQLKDVASNVYTIPARETCRLDLISKSIYGVIYMKPYLIVVNDLIDLSVLTYGYTLYYPSMQNILSVMNETAEYL